MRRRHGDGHADDRHQNNGANQNRRALEGAIITEISTSGATTVLNGVSEEVSFKFNKITYRDERVAPPIVTCGDLALGRKC